MIYWNKVTWYSQILAIILGVVIFFLGFFIGSGRNFGVVQDSVIATQEDTVSDTVWPTLNLPLNFFSYDNVRSGSAGGEYPNWQSARFSNGFRSFPTTTIQFNDYSNEHIELPDLPTDTEWNLLIAEGSPFNWLYKEQGDNYGDLGRRFSNDNMLMSLVESVDVTGDGIPETVLALGDMGGNHQPYYYKIVQDDKIIFESGKGTAQLAGLEPDSTGKGFTLSWRDDKHLTQGLCCAIGNYKTRFVYTDGVFMPLYEQEELYYQIVNISLNNFYATHQNRLPNSQRLQ